MSGGERRNAREIFIAAVAAGRRAKDAASLAGISAQTGWRWYRDSDVRAAVRERQSALLDAATARLVDATTVAITTLVDVATNAEADGARVSASRTLLEHAMRFTEQRELVDRVGTLEAVLTVPHADDHTTKSQAKSAEACRSGSTSEAREE